MQSKSEQFLVPRLGEVFNFDERESVLYELWEQVEVFKGRGEEPSRGRFCMTMPPPNANGELHLGHAYGYTVMDVIGRFERQQGKDVCLIPGKDHAGIQTQVVFERLHPELGEQDEVDEAERYKACYDFCMNRANYMRSQEKTLGISADWQKELFTLDPILSEIVYDTFIKMWNDNLIYKGRRVVNWSLNSQTVVSNMEIEHREVMGTFYHLLYRWSSEGIQASSVLSNLEVKVVSRFEDTQGIWMLLKGKLTDEVNPISISDEDEKAYWVRESHYFSVGMESALECFLESLKDQNIELEIDPAIPEEGLSIALLLKHFSVDDGLVVGTTRPETLFGDMALAVHPDDPRYRSYVGCEVLLPVVGRSLPVIGDSRVKPGFGTGVVKITPAHDFLDFEIGVDNGLECLEVISPSGYMLDVVGKDYSGLSFEQCRAKVVEALLQSSLLICRKDHPHSVPLYARGGDAVQPMLSEQWFVKVDAPQLSLKQRARDLLSEVKIHPPEFRAEFERWLTNLNDWNISRQIWWGHRMPLWHRASNGSIEYRAAKASPGKEWEQVQDTFDTWFSSGQWPYSVLMAHGLFDPATINSESEKVNEYFPTQCIQMGRDILMFWACRMLLLSGYRFNRPPWREIYFTGLIRDADGQKLSKSRGNGIEPAEVIGTYGTDALRLALMMDSSPGVDMQLGERKIEGCARTVHKIWNAARLVEQLLLRENDTTDVLRVGEACDEYLIWISNKLVSIRGEFGSRMESRQLGVGISLLSRFTHDTFCDWFLELIKEYPGHAGDGAGDSVAKRILAVFVDILSLWHPFIPFVTEEIVQSFQPYFKHFGFERISSLAERVKGDSLCIPKAESVSTKETTLDVDELIELISEIRREKVVLLSNPQQRVNIAADVSKLGVFTATVERLAKVRLVEEESIPPHEQVRVVVRGIDCYFQHPDKDSYLLSLQKRVDKLQLSIDKRNSRLNSSFRSKAPSSVVASEESSLNEENLRIIELRKRLAEGIMQAS